MDNLLNSNKLIKLMVLLMAFGIGCRSGKPTEPSELSPNKTVITYTLKKLARTATYGIPSHQLRGIVSSEDGEYVYLVGTQNAALKVLTVAAVDNFDKAKWDDALDFKKVPTAANHKSIINLATQPVGAFSPTKHGLMFTLPHNKGLVVIKGKGGSNASHYPQNSAKFQSGTFAPFLVVNRANNPFIYLFATQATPPAHGIVFRPYMEPPADDFTAVGKKFGPWDNSLKKTATHELDKTLLGRAMDHNKNLLIAHTDGIRRIKEADIGKPHVTLDNGGNVVYGTDHFKLDKSTANTHINTIAMVDNKFLVVGLRSSGSNSGGLAIADITESNPVWHTFGAGLGLSVDSIATERIRDPERTEISALVTTDKGILALGRNGKIIELIKGEGYLITAKSINNHRAEVTDYDKAANGFLGDRIIEPGHSGYGGAAQDRNGMWYLVVKGKSADDGGVYLLDIRSDQVNVPMPPPVLPN